MNRLRAQWPVQSAPDDFADRVVAEALAERLLPRLASVRPVEMPIAPPTVKASVFRSAALAWAVAAAIALGTTGLYFAKIRPDQKERERVEEAALLDAKAESARKDRQIELLTEQVTELLAALEALRADTGRSALRAKRAEEQIRMSGGAAGAATMSACKCQPGDPLCSCL